MHGELKTGQATQTNIFSHFSDQRKRGNGYEKDPSTLNPYTYVYKKKRK